MIRNIIFDMGNVLVDYDPPRYARAFAQNEADAERILDTIFHSPEWTALDAGSISTEDALQSMLSRVPESLYDPVAKTFLHWHELIEVRPEMIGLMRRLKDADYKLFLLSNANVQFELYCDRLAFYPLLDGCVVSAYEHVTKPDPAIYQLLLDRYGLLAQESLFIDDVSKNVLGAHRAGLAAIHYPECDLNHLRSAFHSLGVTVE